MTLKIADKAKEKAEIISFAGKSYVNFDKYFPGISEGKPDPKFFNAVIDAPPNDLHELQYCKLTNSTITMMDNSVLYTKSKIKGIISSRKSASRDHDFSITDPEYSLKYGEDGFGKSRQLSSDILNKSCEMLPYYVPFNSHLHARKQHKSMTNCW